MRLDALPEIALAIAQERAPEAVLMRVARGLADDPTVALARIWLIGPGDQCAGCRMVPECKDRARCLHLAASAGTPVASPGEDWSRTNGDFRRIPLNSGSKISRVAATGVAVVLDDLMSELLRSQVARPEWARRERITSFAAYPLVFRGEVLGLVGVFLRAPLAHASTSALSGFADHAAVAIANARAFEEVERLRAQLEAERDQLDVLLRVTSAAGRELDIGGLVRAVREAVTPVLPLEWMNLALYDAEANALRLHTITLPPGGREPPLPGGRNPEGLPIPIEGTPAGRAFTTGVPFVANTQDEVLAAVQFPPLRAIIEALGMRSGCLVPLISRGQTLGTIGFGAGREHAFDAPRVRLLVQLAGQIAPAVDNALSWERLAALKEQLAKEKLYLEDELRSERNWGELVGQSRSLRATLAGIETVAATSSTVLILGETGTGKELVARAIHELSGRGERTFVKLNCAAIPTGLLESELFGHEKGAFTGAVAQKVGRFELAHKGTLFLDEVGEISPELQPKLLRVLQDQEFERLGGTRTLKVDVRVVAATNRDLAQMVAARQFRSDLYYRLNVFPVAVPPLRERAGDVPLLVRHFVERFARRMGKRIDTIPAAALEALERHPWPGNVRELEHLIERAVILSRGAILEVPLAELAAAPTSAPPSPLPAPAQLAPAPAPPPATAAGPPPGGLTVLEVQERELIVKALEACGWRVGGDRGAAAKLGLSRTTLQSRMQRLGIARPG